jgi:hypothetical protein
MRHGAGFVIAELDPAVNPPARSACQKHGPVGQARW